MLKLPSTCGSFLSSTFAPQVKWYLLNNYKFLMLKCVDLKKLQIPPPPYIETGGTRKAKNQNQLYTYIYNLQRIFHQDCFCLWTSAILKMWVVYQLPLPLLVSIVGRHQPFSLETFCEFFQIHEVSWCPFVHQSGETLRCECLFRRLDRLIPRSFTLQFNIIIMLLITLALPGS